MDNVEQHIETYDCLPFNSATATADVLQTFIESQSSNIFRFSSTYNSDDDSRLAEYDYRSNKWIAGRFVGEAYFSHKGSSFKITIKPRFGEKMLLRMLEEIFNIRITSSASQHSTSTDWLHFIKKIIAFIWIQKLANANLHGLPKQQIVSEYKGSTIRGRLNVRRSIMPLHLTNEVVSNVREKKVDDTISQILYQAYRILKSDFQIGSFNVPDTAQEAINQINITVQRHRFISDNEYNNIRYKEIYRGWRPVVDLSWDIIKRKQLSLKQDKAKEGVGFFLDMAEIWEQYLRAILKRNLAPYGWQLKTEKQIAYKGCFFRRELIPDLVFHRGNEIAVWDAKYKRMMGRQIDVDRADFFQIHTYIQNFLHRRQVKAGGLLFPISNLQLDSLKHKSPYLIHEDGMKTHFSIDGVELEETIEVDNISIKEDKFISRILESLNHI